MNIEYYVYFEGVQYGPYSIEYVRSLNLSKETKVMTSYSNEWRPITDYPELRNSANGDVSPDIVPPPMTVPGVTTPPPIVPPSIDAASDLYNKSFYLRDGEGQTYGPLTVAELSIIGVEPETMISVGSMGNWKAASEVPELLDIISIFAESGDVVSADSMQNSELKDIIEEQEREILHKEEELARLKDIQNNPLLSLSAIEIIKRAEDLERDLEQFKISEIRTFGTMLGLQTKLTDLLTVCTKLSDQDRFSDTEITKMRLTLQRLIKVYDEACHSWNDESYEMNSATHEIWSRLNPSKRKSPASTLHVGQNTKWYRIFDEPYAISIAENVTLLNTHNIVARYNAGTQEECFSFINTLIARMLMSSMPGRFNVKIVDAVDFDGISSILKKLTRQVSIYSREQDIRAMLEKELQSIQSTILNQLVAPYNNIGEYNDAKSSPAPYTFIVVKAFPVNLREDSVMLLRQIMTNGPRAGVNVVLLIDEERLNGSEKAQRELELMGLPLLADQVHQYDFVNREFPFSHDEVCHTQHFRFDLLSEIYLDNIVKLLSEQPETDTADAVWLSNYVPPKEKWWTKSSASMMSIPFGITVDKELVKLDITQESGENSAMVIGVPGSGKSVFLHTIICSSIVKYSPDELELYLMDFSGVEFNKYAVNKLPHAKVIAPEAEREFGLSVLRELKEEGARRMELCRDCGVSNIVDFRNANPDVHMPRLLVIIDEFQKLFEIETDAISREAMTIIHVIIKEFRKFGINLILATQKMADISSSILPKDLIANRVVFKCSPSDVGLIGMNTVPQLRTGECIYNSELGEPSANRKVKTFYATNSDIENILQQVSEMSGVRNMKVADTLIFRSADLPDFRQLSNVARQDNPASVNVFFGEPIAISEMDVCATLSRRSCDNILIIGGEPSVSQRLAISTGLSLMSAHNDKTAQFVFLNFMRPTDELSSLPMSMYNTPIFDSIWANKGNAVIEALTSVKAEIEARIADEDRPQTGFYLTVYAMELAQIFKRGGRRGEDVSDAGKLLAYVLKKGPLVGVYTVLQVDTYTNLKQIGDDVVNDFAHRVALQMDERDSQKIVGNDIASRLYVMNRPSSRNRAFYYNTRNRTLVKFKPYKI